ncbi:bifunctional 23S rRNA (guanine(2069)-N(7))-methyltransferase RlmK/23S rRNA (guanine(2445)-N(2))-methyltransferase RlmL [Beggiatoa leptomitoformis]|uniref:Ribosomal RNA large subunit methyltransferase K/L n=1 Tax=Beggiatoa leptomitoformis TaxID=288004 RepID=A0A2N9YEV4_9GAMM|nr:bifunctional 23S rRNA (guanine(2069)-N(7))-methyltransferase RlmK/23S rRNA (guanine(2445)-N(2))-methyltransferase RlmL [Beggiatoa leptomitoformis]ALG68634.1 bifunctional 23S rRNA (guanine(2069)-N(7))-methyltransferase RlmK/23S rRNA (guanine(2445)-N(2))-methyltransferase RlmL [Beggiatoa leptomitoformis]AUI69017.1 bifunctional 23S rRNA (guanine(2069)-N(7))-methyltransferase RlmK/23S rRNA (guanine(2445)-N(2))-methyltransferase RlmL [Beggiatoa leptomitoformis]
MSDLLSLFATSPKGMEPLLADELTALGLSAVKPTRAGVSFQGTLRQAYQVCLWSRIANRVLLPLATFPAPQDEALYEGVLDIDWTEHLDPAGSIAVDFTSLHSAITHTHFGALRVKDAIVDQFRNRYNTRPNVALDQPDLRINVYLHQDTATISLDLSGDSLHRRAYRETGIAAPLKENLAAALLARTRWKEIAQTGGMLLDPMCGSGTLLIEGAFIAGDIAPALLRPYFGFSRWLQHVPKIWKDLIAEASARKQAGLATLPPIVGYDADATAIRVAIRNIENAGLHGKIHVERRALAQTTAPARSTGLFIVNPPYGERLGEVDSIRQLFSFLGSTLREHFVGWQAGVLSGNAELGKQIGIRAEKVYTLYNGALECKFLRFNVTPEWFMRYTKPTQTDGMFTPATPAQLAKMPVPLESLSDNARMFANRLQKNLKSLGSWAKQDDIRCYRLYDADMPEYAIAVDKYEQWIHIQEYAPPKSIDPQKAETRFQEALQACSAVLKIPLADLFVKVRRQQKGRAQYEKFDEAGQFYEVHEGKAVLLVNFTDYLDTGLFLDHRITRQWIYELAQGKRFLNLFAYTGSATVQAALGGASGTTTVDMSNVYLNWAKRNLARNGFSDHRHHFVQADCFTWLEEEAERLVNSPYRLPRYDLIFLDPPTFSNSKRMEDTLDVQRDHVGLIRAAMHCLTRDGLLIFSTNYQRFKLDMYALGDLNIEDVSAASLPFDYARNPKIHQCWKIKF